MTNNFDGPSAAPDTGTIGYVSVTPQADHFSPTLPSDAESLLKHLRLGAPRREAPARPPGEFPNVPNYEFVSELGRGGMGIVYKARHAALRHVVAVKMILMTEYA